MLGLGRTYSLETGPCGVATVSFGRNLYRRIIRPRDQHLDQPQECLLTSSRSPAAIRRSSLRRSPELNRFPVSTSMRCGYVRPEFSEDLPLFCKDFHLYESLSRHRAAVSRREELLVGGTFPCFGCVANRCGQSAQELTIGLAVSNRKEVRMFSCVIRSCRRISGFIDHYSIMRSRRRGDHRPNQLSTVSRQIGDLRRARRSGRWRVKSTLAPSGG